MTVRSRTCGRSDPLAALGQSCRVAPRQTEEGCRPFEMDHYEINERWKDLPMVLEGRERGDVYEPEAAKKPGALTANLKDELTRLAGIEQALALEYLYARYSVRFNDETLTVTEQEYANFIAHELLVIAISEMTHLRWVNQLLRELHQHPSRYVDSFKPALQVAEVIPPTNREAESRTLEEAIDDFLAAEEPSGSVDGQYAQLFEFFTTHEYPADLIGLVKKIIDDGVTHYSRFREIKSLLDRYPGKLVRPLKRLPVNSPTYKKPVSIYKSLIASLRESYSKSGNPSVKAGERMKELDNEMARLAKKRGIGVPLIEIAMGKKGSE